MRRIRPSRSTRAQNGLSRHRVVPRFGVPLSELLEDLVVLDILEQRQMLGRPKPPSARCLKSLSAVPCSAKG